MRIFVLISALCVAAMFGGSPNPAAAGPWCYNNEDEHCDQPSFATCHFGTLGNGGYCYINSNYHGKAGLRRHEKSWTAPGPIAARHRCDNCAETKFAMHHFGNIGTNDFRAIIGSDPLDAKLNARTVLWVKPDHVDPPQAVDGIDRPLEAMASAAKAISTDDKPTCQLEQRGSSGGDRDKVACRPEQSRTVPKLVARAESQPSVARKAPVNGPPLFNVALHCRTAAAIIKDERYLDVCLGDQTSARDQLAKEWEQFPQSDRSRCVSVSTIGGGGTYTHLISCLQVARDMRSLPRENASVLLAQR